MFSQPLYFNYRMIFLIFLTNRSFPFLLLHPKEWLNHPRRGKPKEHLHNKCHLNRDNFRKWLHSQHRRKDRLHLQKQLCNHSRHPNPENVTFRRTHSPRPNSPPQAPTSPPTMIPPPKRQAVKFSDLCIKLGNLIFVALHVGWSTFAT